MTRNSNIKSPLLQGMLWNVIKAFFERGFVFLQQLILARLLIPEDFGAFAKINSVVMILSFCNLIGISEILISRNKAFNIWHPYAKKILTVISILSILCCIFYGIFDFIVLKQEGQLFPTILLSSTLYFQSVGNIYITNLNLGLKFKLLSKIQIIKNIILVVSSVCLALLNCGLLSFIFSSVISEIIYYLILKNYVTLPKATQSGSKRHLILFFKSTQLFLFNLSWRIINFIDFIIIGYLLGEKSAGFYYVAFSISIQPISLFISFLPGILFSNQTSQNLSLQDSSNKIKDLLFYLALISLPIFTSFYFFSTEIITLLLGDQWKISSPMLKILSIAMFFKIISSQWTVIPLLKKEFVYMSKISIIYLVCFIFLFYGFTYAYNSIGSSIAILIFNISMLFLVPRNILFDKLLLKKLILLLFICFSIFYIVNILSRYFDMTGIYYLLINIVIASAFYLFTTFLIFKSQVNRIFNILFKSI